MRRLIAVVGVAGLVACAGAAQAGDGAQPWTGFYVGAHAGYGWGEWDGSLSYDDANKYPALVFDDSSRSIEGDSWLGGLQLGANYQSGAWVLGVEADVSWTDLGGSGSFLPYPDNPGSPAWAIQSNLDLFGTVRGRLGYAMDRYLAYGTAGLAYGRGDVSLAGLSNEQTHVGYTLGAGLEAMIAPNITARLEYLYVDLGRETYTTVLGQGRVSFDANIVRTALNYKF